MSESSKTPGHRPDADTAARAQAAPAPSKTTWLLLIVAIVLVIAGLVAFYVATRFAREAHQANQNEAGVVTVKVGAHECTPNELTVPAGLSTFRIVNTSDRAVEWEILDGVMVIEERENIAPAFAQTLTAQLAPGDYDITCGLLSNPRGKLHVTPTAQSDQASKAAPSMTDFVGPLSEYRVYVTLQSMSLVSAVQALNQAIAGNDVAAAKTAYADAHHIYMHLAPIADLFSDLDKRLDAPADFYDKREKDPGFTGFHRVQYGLFGAGAPVSLATLAAPAQQLAKDADALKKRMDDLSIEPKQLSVATARRVELIATALTASNEEAHASMSPGNVAPALEGVSEIVGLLKPLLTQSNAALGTTLGSDLDAALAQAKSVSAAAGDDATFASLDAGQREQLAKKLTTLAADLRRINPALGLN
ncbi:iron uptake system protein EfeO [Paraburkholderia sp. BCC1886]|uniref:iron uptake system protein EfeO n=1 Tax=Paraburkholderia sp. BCC1886 TaxID=2562670 RepID=UPI00118433F6|nr:iron uptake system protein EfeO [Paraburkholderia sp. BCC1886]